MLAMAAISNTSTSPTRPSSPGPAFTASPNCEGQQIASYIRSLPVPSPGRPWNPPYQPGPGLDRQPVANWAAGAGLAWALDNDSGTLPFIFGAKPATRLERACCRASRASRFARMET